jgi:3-hydroxybutyryl-CoA dehydratase
VREDDFLGRFATRDILVDERLVKSFGDLVGDHNPLHFDAEVANAGRFGGPVAHGLLVAGLFSGILGEELPGPGTIYLSQSLVFQRPVYVGQRVQVNVRVVEVNAAKRRIRLETIAIVGSDVVVSGEAIVLVDDVSRGQVSTTELHVR